MSKVRLSQISISTNKQMWSDNTLFNPSLKVENFLMVQVFENNCPIRVTCYCYLSKSRPAFCASILGAG